MTFSVKRLAFPLAMVGAALGFAETAPSAAIPAIAPPIAARDGSFYCTDSALSWLSLRGGMGDEAANHFLNVPEMIASTGFAATRDRFYWAEVQPSPDRAPEWGRYLDNARHLKALGVDVLCVFHDAPGWVRGGGERLPRNLAALFRFSREAAGAFRDEAAGWEFWNEPFYPATPEAPWETAAAFKAAALGFRAAETRASVLNPSLVFGRRNDFDEVFFASGLAAYADALNLHVYRPLADYPAVFADLREAMSRWGMADVPVWVTESGLVQEGKAAADGIDGRKAHSPDQERLQAEFWVKSQVLMQMEGVARNFFFIFGAYSENGGEKDWGALRRDGSSKLVCAAMAEMMSKVGDAAFEGELDVGEGVRAFLFRKHDGSQTVLHWAVSPLETAGDGTTVSAEPDFARSFSLNGKVVWASRFARYAEGLHGLVAAVPPRPVGSRSRPKEPDGVDLSVVIEPILSRDDFTLCSGKSAAALTKKTGRIQIAVWNLSDTQKTGSLRVAGCHLDGLPESVVLPPMGCVHIDATCASDALPEGTPVTVEISGVFDGRRTTPAAMRLKSRHALLENSCAIPLGISHAERWHRNDSADSFAVAADEADGSCRFSLLWRDRRDKWLYPQYELDLPVEDLEDADLLVFEARLTGDKPGATYHRVCFIGPDGEKGVNLPLPTEQWSEYQIDLKDGNQAGDGKPGIETADIRRLAFGCNPKGTNVEYSVRNARILRGRGAKRLFGVNYLAPFSASYQEMRSEGIDIRSAMRRDVAQFVRLGLNGIRVHYFDREISTPDGGLVANDHLALMDELIALCASNGIKTVVTLISGWPTPCDIGGFASGRNRSDLTSNSSVIDAECRFVGELIRHINPFTGLRYADDPAIAAFELLNEPKYPAGLSDDKVTELVNRLADAAREAGTRKPLYWNCWLKREKASAAARIDGVSGSSYPTGLDSGAARKGNRLAMVRRSSIRDVPELRDLKKMIYEFDAADVPGAYMFPAMARQFCAEGMDMAFHFHYIATDIAPRNRVGRTHHLNLFHTPAKAISLAIAAEVFRRLPRGEAFPPACDEMAFPPFRIVPAENLSEMVTERDYLHTADTGTQPPAPERLTRIWGCGSSPVFESDGNGCHFLDKCADGVWRLQLAPSVVDVADPYAGGSNVKTVIQPDMIAIRIGLDDLGMDFSAWQTDGTPVGRAIEGCIVLSAGDYVLTRGGNYGDAERNAVEASGIPAFVVPSPSFAGHARIQPREASPPTAASGWNFFDPAQAANTYVSGAKISAEDDGRGDRAVAMRLGNLDSATTFAEFASGCDDAAFARLFPSEPLPGSVMVRARALEPATTKMEMVVVDVRGFAWTTIVPLTEEWRDIPIPSGEFVPYLHATGREPPNGEKFDIRKAIDIHFAIGQWLFPDTAAQPHGIAVSGVRMSPR